MIRIVLVALLVVVAWFAIMGIVKMSRERRIDWTGIAFMIGFVVIAFWLRQVSGMG